MQQRDSQEFHLSTEQLLDYLERRLTPVDTAEVEAHLATQCEECQAEFTWLQETLNLMVSNIWLEPPARLRTAARQMFHDHRQQNKPTFSLGDWFGSLWAQPRPLVIAATVLVILIVVGGLLPRLWPTETNPESADVVATTGTVEYQVADTGVWVPIPEDVVLESGSEVRTDADSSVILSFPDESLVYVEPNTELQIVQMLADPDSLERIIVLRQISGSTHHIVNASHSPNSRFVVETPSASVSVKGTEFTVEIDSTGGTRVVVMDGVVEVAAQGSTVALTAGEMTTVRPGGQPIAGTLTPIATGPATRESSPIGSTSAAKPPNTATPTPVVSRTPTPTNTTVPIPTNTSSPGVEPQPTATAVPPDPTATSFPTETPPVPPTPVPTETPKKTKVPPGLTRTPEPPGRTVAPSKSKNR